MSQKIIRMRPSKFSRPMLALADAFVPLVQRMLRDPELVFARPAGLDARALPAPLPSAPVPVSVKLKHL